MLHLTQAGSKHLKRPQKILLKRGEEKSYYKHQNIWTKMREKKLTFIGAKAYGLNYEDPHQSETFSLVCRSRHTRGGEAPMASLSVYLARIHSPCLAFPELQQDHLLPETKQINTFIHFWVKMFSGQKINFIYNDYDQGH